jgi:hypothetical protein
MQRPWQSDVAAVVGSVRPRDHTILCCQNASAWCSSDTCDSAAQSCWCPALADHLDLSTQVLWLSADGARAAWVCLASTGAAPSLRMHHSANAFDGGRQVAVYGGEGFGINDVGTDGQPAVYVLDAGELTWQRRVTSAATPTDFPGVRSLHLSLVAVSSPRTNSGMLNHECSQRPGCACALGRRAIGL